MDLAWLSLAALLLVIVVSCTTSVNPGILAIVLAGIIGVYLAPLWGTPIAIREVMAGFPTELFLTLVGVTLLFTQAHVNGTLDRVAHAAVRCCRGNVGLMPIMFFFLALTFATIGAGNIAASALMSPMAMAVASRARIPSFLMTIMVAHGSIAGALSPFSPTGIIADRLMRDKLGLVGYEWQIFAHNLIANALVAFAGYFAFGGWRLLFRLEPEAQARDAPRSARVSDPAAPPSEDARSARVSDPAAPPSESFLVLRRPPVPAAAGSETRAEQRETRAEQRESEAGAEQLLLTWQHWVTLAVIASLILAVIFFRVHVGLAALAGSIVLTLSRAGDEHEAVRKMPWGVILMVCGVTVLTALLEKTGGADRFVEIVGAVSTPYTVTGVIAFITGLVSVYSSTSGVVLPAFLPLVPGLVRELGGGDPLAIASAIIIGGHLVDSSPLSTIGALCIACAPVSEDRRLLFNKVLVWGLSMAVVGAVGCYVVFGLLG